MATDYTECIRKGISFKNFVLRCSRVMGALVEMCDDPLDAPIPKEIKPSNDYVEDLEKAKTYLNKLLTMNLTEAKINAQKEYDREIKSNIKYEKEKKELLKKYDLMLDKVREWQPPTQDHVNFKEFMIEQITKSIEWDCTPYNKNTVLLSPEKWLDNEIIKTKKNISYYENEQNEEIERCKANTKWIQDLMKSLENYEE
jgi:hypothetical protein